MHRRELVVRIVFISILFVAVLVGLGLTYLSGQSGSQPPGESSGFLEWIRMFLDSSGG